MGKTLLRILTVFVLSVFSTGNAFAQCANDNVLIAGNLTPPGLSLTTTVNYASGQYVLATVVAGAQYTIETCGSSSWDTQITVYEDATGNFVVYNDDFCGLQSTVTFTPVTCGLVRVLLDQYFCTTGSSSTDVSMTMDTPGSGAPVLSPAPDQSACFGQSANIGIVGNGTGGLPPYVYGWLPAANLTTTTQPATTVTTVTSTTTYTLELTDANGCRDLDTVIVSVLPAPPVTLGADTTICATNYTLDAGNPGSAYLWNTGAGTQTLNITQSGTYSVSVQFPNGCINQDAITITLTPPPAFSIGSDTSSCGNNLVVDAGSGYSSYAWSTGSTTQTEIITASDTIGVTVIDANGCVLTDSIAVTLNPAPVVALGADITQCGGPVTLDAGNPGALFFWSNSTSSQTTNVSSSGTYYVDVLTQAGCPGSDTIVVTINNQPIVNLGPDTSICLTSVLLDAGNPGSTYLWSTSQTSQVVTVGTGTFWVTATDPSGCADTDTIAVTTNSVPVITASADTAICPGGTATLTASGASTYLWSNNMTGSTITLTPATNTAYYVTGTDTNGCQASEVVVITILPTATALFTTNVIGATVYVNNQSTGATSYSWNFGDSSPADNTANPSHTYAVNGTYVVTLTVGGACGTLTYTQTVVITEVGIQDNDLANTLSIYPNPNNGQFTVSFEFAEQKDVVVEMIDVSGRVISSLNQENVLTFKQELGDGELADGIYFVRITTADGVVTKKIVVQK
ncbi:MAG TPA: T9SS type A sorting domain-containing protein [Bacteroidia bacterium]|nr:T9SS type A sorting domain-containing protein [Bacteroidia bacterium]